MTETKKKEPGMAQLTIILCVITAVTSCLLGLVNYITVDRIAEIKAEKTAVAMKAVMPSAPEGWGFPLIDKEFGGIVKGAYDGSNGAYVIQVEPSGFGGAIDMVVGISATGEITGVSIIAMAETSGLGDNAKNPSFTDQYLGENSPMAVDKDGGSIDSLTGATVTSRAVTDGVNDALNAYAALK